MKRGGALAGFGFVAPFLAIYLFILIYPLIAGIGLSFRRVDLFGGGGGAAAGDLRGLLLAREGVAVLLVADALGERKRRRAKGEENGEGAEGADHGWGSSTGAPIHRSPLPEPVTGRPSASRSSSSSVLVS